MFTSVGYRGWKSIRKSLEKHQSSGGHKSSMARWAGFKQTKDHEGVTDLLVSLQYKKTENIYVKDSPFVRSSGPGT